MIYHKDAGHWQLDAREGAPKAGSTA